MGPHQGRAEGQDDLPPPAGHTLPDAPQDAIGLLGHKGTLLAPGHPIVHQDSQVFRLRAALQQVTPNLYWYMGLFLPRCSTLHLSLLKFIRFLSAQLSSLSRSHWIQRDPAHITLPAPSFRGQALHNFSFDRSPGESENPKVGVAVKVVPRDSENKDNVSLPATSI
ncbi:sterol regulatory element-binding protein cleavage-activating hypothetical protein [Limosa lapponica baueri]|uniref:Uncharacterized protein n=1 Tax=Limosa lapponica baueri TaxID=1758121 RepID=A0A2I0U306_LIMLA|nr:sterol regulatory element-binding protein cleavage-activating hypothetical protein [Limosa lapponica baueri]